VTLWPSTITLAGSTVALTDVQAELTIHHGRSDVFDDAAPSTCQITILDVDKAFAQAFRVGAALTVTVQDPPAAAVPRFTGWVTDGELDTDDLTMIAVSKLGQLSLYTIGAAAWPVEPWSARVTRIFTEAGLSSLLDLRPDPAFDPPLAARDPATAGTTTLGDYLNFLAPMIGAAVADKPDGKILVQAVGARTIASRFALDPALVAYAPAWHMVLPRGNVVTVRYQADQGASVVVRDDASVALYGERKTTTDTSFTSSADATTRANQLLSRGAYAHWNILEAPVLAGLDLTVGTPVDLTSMPAASPFDPWTPILEGWTDQISGEDWTMTLALSDQLSSGLTLPWNAVPVDPAYQWNTIDQTVAWRDALTLDALHA